MTMPVRGFPQMPTGPPVCAKMSAGNNETAKVKSERRRGARGRNLFTRRLPVRSRDSAAKATCLQSRSEPPGGECAALARAQKTAMMAAHVVEGF